MSGAAKQLLLENLLNIHDVSRRRDPLLLAPGNSNGGQRQSAYIFVMDLEKVI